jgi:hypothetical protein
MHNVLYPIITAIGDAAIASGCALSLNVTQCEFTPHEYRSCDAHINGMVKTPFHGSLLSNGKARDGKCTIDFDNIGFVTGVTNYVSGFLYDTLAEGNGTEAALANALQVRHGPFQA